jgi:SAM-dependent methyltransferase
VATTHTLPEVGAWPPDGLEEVRACPVCESPARYLLYDGLTDRSYRCAPGSWSLYRCERCSCAYLDPRPDRRTAPLAYRTYYAGAEVGRPAAPTAGWRRFRRALRNDYLNATYGYALAPAARGGRFLVPLVPRHRALADEHVRHLRLAPRTRPHLLDVGCGEGHFLVEMQELGWAVAGVDPSAEAVALARARGVHATQGTLDDLPSDERSLDAITFRLVFEHIGSPVAALARCRAILVTGGMLWIATPSLDAAAHRRFGRHWLHLEPPRHAVVYSAAGLVGLLGRTGFEVVALRPLRHAQWSFRLSNALAHGYAPFENPPPLPRGLALDARRADLHALRRPETADVLIVLARAA